MFSSPPLRKSPTSPTLRITPICTQGEIGIFNLTASIEDALLTTTNDTLEIIKISCEINPSMSNPWYTLSITSRTNNQPPVTTNYSYLSITSVDALAIKFIKDFPTIEITAEELTAKIARGLDQKNVLLSPLNPGMNKAVFISGEDPEFGNWEWAVRLTYNTTQKAWRLTKGLQKGEYKCLTGDFTLGKKIAEVKELIWEQHDNRQLTDTKYENTNNRPGV
jgi:hypothetical protein